MDGVFQGSSSVSVAAGNPVVTIGNFDGVHRGHQALLNHTLEVAKRLDTTACAYTFDPAPRDVLRPDNPVIRIQCLDDRIASLQSAGIDAVVVEPFTLEFSRNDAQWFAEEILVRRLRACAVVVGWDFRFGRGRAGGVDELARWLTIPVEQVAAFEEGSQVISSSRIRRALHDGKVTLASELLGRMHEVVGQVVSGDRRGRELGYPTANLHSRTPLIPKDGVYAVWAELEGGERLRAVCNVGTRPTFGPGGRKVEVHLMNQSVDLYDRTLRRHFARRLRDEIRFSERAALVAQIEQDIQVALEWLR